MNIVFTQLKPSNWQFKTALSLRKNGHKTTLICLFNKYNEEEYKKAFDEIICPELNSLKPFKFLKQICCHPIKFISFFRFLFIQPDATICEAPPHYLSALFIWWFKGCNTIYFPYDMISSRYKEPEKYLRWIERWGEKYAFRNCDKIIYKSADSEFNLLPEEIQESIKNKPRLSFPCYCQSDLFITPDIDVYDYNYKKEIHLVNAGTFTEGSPLYRSMYEYLYLILKQGFHLDFYTPSTALTEEDIKNITKGDKGLLKRFHIHNEFLSSKQFIKELSGYDYGINLIYFSDVAKGKAKEIPATNKFSSYLEAGIPILINKQLKYFADIVKKNQIGIVVDDWNLKDLKEKIEKADYNNLVENVVRFRKEYSVDKNINKLIEFVEK